MNCEKCGAPMNDNFRVCPQCGAPVRGQEEKITTTSTYYGSLGNPTPVLVWGIVGLAFSLTFYLSFLGVIFSIVGLRKANTYNEFTRYAPSTKAKIGKRLSIAGIIVGIIMTILLILFIVGLASIGRQSYYYYY